MARPSDFHRTRLTLPFSVWVCHNANVDPTVSFLAYGPDKSVFPDLRLRANYIKMLGRRPPKGTPGMTKILLVSKSASVRNGLNYLFSVILKFDFECIDFEACATWGKKDHSVNVIFFDMTELEGRPTAWIEQLCARADDAILIALQKPEGRWGAEAFHAGAVDVVTWPTNLRELSARLTIRLPEGQMRALPATEESWDVEAYIALRAGLTTAEAQIMRVLFAQDGKIVTRDALSLAVECRPWRYGDRKFDVHVAKIRKKFAQTFASGISVKTIRSSGYMLTTEALGTFNEN